MTDPAPTNPAESGGGETALVRGAGVAAWRQIADALEGAIRDGTLAPGDRLPAEERLAARWAVNRHTVRRAVAALAGKGLVRATQGRGTFVERRPLPYVIGPRTRFSETIARGGHEAGGELIASAVEPAPAGVAARLALAAGAPVLRIDHRRLIDGAPATVGRTHLPLPRFAGLDRAYARTGSMSAALAACGVGDYRRRTTVIAARPAEADEAARLDLAPGRVVFVVEGTDVDAEGRPVLTTVALFPADRFELRVES
jgi:GntR family phosphonate transport system transcriptional regulator